MRNFKFCTVRLLKEVVGSYSLGTLQVVQGLYAKEEHKLGTKNYKRVYKVLIKLCKYSGYISLLDRLAFTNASLQI